jgi:hypothetical protein
LLAFLFADMESSSVKAVLQCILLGVSLIEIKMKEGQTRSDLAGVKA